MSWKLHRLYKRLRYGKHDARRYGHLALESLVAQADEIEFMGWNYDRVHHEMRDRRMVVMDAHGNIIYEMPLLGVKREDVVLYVGDRGALYSGFYGSICVATSEKLSAYIEYEAAGETFSTLFFEIEPNCKKCPDPQIESLFPYPLLEPQIQDTINEPLEDLADIGDSQWELVDVVVPVYDGFDFLPTLFESIDKTDVPYHLIIVDDASPDVRVQEYLDAFVAKRPHSVTLLRNEENMGFLRSVNRALENTTRDVVIVNTDVELPQGWLERMIAPVIQQHDIASVTPFTNSGTICSFPRFCEDNHLQAGMDVQMMDSFFRALPMELFDVPTGVGFCMTMSRKAIDEIGVFDEESFGRGYAEENDWCRRALAAGYRNVHVGNLFVYHNHGGSFQSEEKRELVRMHLEVLEKKHPGYSEEISDYIKTDPARHLRRMVERNILAASSAASIVIIDHRLGGGANLYAKNKCKEFMQEGKRITIIQYDEGLNLFLVVCRLDAMEFRFSALDMSSALRAVGKIDEIWVNELVSYPNVSQMLQLLPACAQAHRAKLIFPLHDFYALCQSYNLINSDKRFCGVPGYAVCNSCFHKVRSGEFSGTGIDEYRTLWRGFLSRCDRIICFSQSSRDLLMRAYPDLNNIDVRPHDVDPLPLVDRKARTRKNLIIGVMGMISYIKGRDVIKNLLEYIKSQRLDIEIVIMGGTDRIYEDLEELETGWYERKDIPEIAVREGIDVFFIPSIWPETFSYTTAEIMSMGYPIAVFDLGAPAERVAEYDRGVVIPQDATSAMIVDALRELAFDTVHIDKLPVKREECFLVVSDAVLEDADLSEYRLALMERGFMPVVVRKSEISKINVKTGMRVIIIPKLLLDENDAKVIQSTLGAQRIETLTMDIAERSACDL